MLTRKLVKAGPSSHTIALPKEWIEKNYSREKIMETKPHPKLKIVRKFANKFTLPRP